MTNRRYANRETSARYGGGNPVVSYINLFKNNLIFIFKGNKFYRNSRDYRNRIGIQFIE